ncbi:hypothetical protein [Longibacter sp.]|jgi:hypothetical protein|uniref:hypothetical protein n=1 Tax=Longibacter sp. TaxID=2045415 RepID=UPI003EB72593
MDEWFAEIRLRLSFDPPDVDHKKCDPHRRLGDQGRIIMKLNILRKYERALE